MLSPAAIHAAAAKPLPPRRTCRNPIAAPRHEPALPRRGGKKDGVGTGHVPPEEKGPRPHHHHEIGAARPRHGAGGGPREELAHEERQHGPEGKEVTRALLAREAQQHDERRGPQESPPPAD